MVNLSGTRMPNMSDAVRKRTLADFVVKTKKQVVKLYVVAKWARDAAAVQKAMVCQSLFRYDPQVEIFHSECRSILN